MAEQDYVRLAAACHCGRPVAAWTGSGRKPSIYCSRACKTSAWRAANPQRAAEHRAKEAASIPKLCAYTAKACAGCGQPWGARREWSLCARCSAEQQRAAARSASRAWSEAKHKAAGRVIKCSECECEYCPLYGAKPGAVPLCSPCAKQRAKAHEAKRRALMRGASDGHAVCRVSVFERDGWRCRLCGVSTPRALMGTTEPNAPELDHDVPVSRGGAHSYSNTQCLCRSCNGCKGVLTMAEALRQKGRGMQSPQLLPP